MSNTLRTALRLLVKCDKPPSAEMFFVLGQEMSKPENRFVRYVIRDVQDSLTKGLLETCRLSRDVDRVHMAALLSELQPKGSWENVRGELIEFEKCVIANLEVRTLSDAAESEAADTDFKSIRAAHQAAIACLTYSEAILTLAKCDERVFGMQFRQNIPGLLESLQNAIEHGKIIQRVGQWLTFGPAMQFEDLPSRNAHFAAWQLAVKIGLCANMVKWAHGKFESNEFRKQLLGLPKYDLDSLSENVEAEFARALHAITSVSGDGGEGGAPPAARSKGIPLAEAEIKVREWLAANAKADPAAITRDAVAFGTGVSAGQVSNTAAWKAFRERRDAKAKPAVREIPLTDSMQAVVPSNCETPFELAALIEEQKKDEAEQERRHKRRHGPS